MPTLVAAEENNKIFFHELTVFGVSVLKILELNTFIITALHAIKKVSVLVNATIVYYNI